MGVGGGVDHVARIGGAPYHWKQAIKSMSFPAIQFVRHIAQFHIQFYGRTSRSPIYFTTVRRLVSPSPPTFFPLFSFFFFNSPFFLSFSLSRARSTTFPFLSFIRSPLSFLKMRDTHSLSVYHDITSFFFLFFLFRFIIEHC